MISHNTLTETIINSFQEIAILKNNNNTGGLRRKIKGYLWEELLLNISSNIIEEKNLPYTINKKSIICNVSGRIFRRKPDITIYNNGLPIILISCKDYGDSTQACSEITTFRIMKASYPSIRKCIYFRGWKGGSNNKINDLLSFDNLTNSVFLYNFIDKCRVSNRETFLLDYNKEQIIEYIYNLNNFLSTIIE